MSSKPKPLLTLHVGQAGIQIGHAAWELLCLEHNIEPDGTPKVLCDYHGNLETVFVPTAQGKHFPRTIFVDTDPACVDEARSGPYRGLFNSRQLLSDEQDAGSNYATGRYGYTKKLVPDTVDRLRWLAEKTDVRPTVFLVHSACGGTGSGFTITCLSRAAEDLGLDAPNVLDLCVVPGRMAAQNSCELLNTAMYLDESQELVRQTICVSNSAMFRVCASQLQSNGGATYAHVNRALAAAFSNLTATERLPGANASLAGLLDSLSPFQNLKFPQLACAPFLTVESARTERPTAKTATTAVLKTGSQFLDVDPRRGRHVAGFLLFRGDAALSDTQQLAAEVATRGRLQFFDWAPAGFHTGLVPAPPVAPPGSGFADSPVSVTMVSTHSGISEVFSELAAAARRLFEREVFVGNYVGAIEALMSLSGAGKELQRRESKTASAETANQQQQQQQEQQDQSEQQQQQQQQQEQQEKPRVRASILQLQQDLKKDLERPSNEQQNKDQQKQEQQQDQQDQQRNSQQLDEYYGLRTRVGRAIDNLDNLARCYSEEVLGDRDGNGGGDGKAAEEGNQDGATNTTDEQQSSEGAEERRRQKQQKQGESPRKQGQRDDRAKSGSAGERDKRKSAQRQAEEPNNKNMATQLEEEPARLPSGYRQSQPAQRQQQQYSPRQGQLPPQKQSTTESNDDLQSTEAAADHQQQPGPLSRGPASANNVGAWELSDSGSPAPVNNGNQTPPQGCLRRSRRKDSQLAMSEPPTYCRPHRQVAGGARLSANVAAEASPVPPSGGSPRHPAIAEAERILLKHQKRLSRE